MLRPLRQAFAISLCYRQGRRPCMPSILLVLIPRFIDSRQLIHAFFKALVFVQAIQPSLQAHVPGKVSVAPYHPWRWEACQCLCFGLLFSILACQGIVSSPSRLARSTPLVNDLVVRKFYLSGVVASVFTTRTVWCPSTQILYFYQPNGQLFLFSSRPISPSSSPSSGYDLVVLGIHARLYVVLAWGVAASGIPECTLLSFLGFRSRFSIMFKLLQIHSLLANNAHVCCCGFLCCTE